MANELSPIGISTYTRIEHLKKTIAALQKNTLASQSELFVFSDAPKVGDETRVAEVRDFLRTVDGFKEVHIIERSENNRIANNRGGISMLLERYGRIIFLEDDVVTAPGFLAFMNQALDQYKDDQRFFSVVGYCPPINVPPQYESDLFFLKRFSGWGFGIWKDRFELIRKIPIAEYHELVRDRNRLKTFSRNAGEDVVHMLRLDCKGILDTLDVIATYALSIHDMYTAYPKLSLAQNIGFDGSGVNCSATNFYDVLLDNKVEFKFPDSVFVDPAIVECNYRFRKRRGRRRFFESLHLYLESVFARR